jgi:hypothetical protein
MLSKLLRFVLKQSKTPKSRLSWAEELAVWIVIILVLTWWG